jgi:PAT family beta-lactamase induction signal transducer AmpG
MRRMSVFAALFAFGGLQGAALLLFSLLATVGHNKLYLTWAVGCENFASAMATAAYMAFMASQTNRRFTATQYALLSSLLGAATLLAGSATGILAERLGWSLFFLACIAATLPGLLLLLPLRRLASAR